MNGKGSKFRPVKGEVFRKNFDDIFGKKKKLKKNLVNVAACQ